ncbi:MAG: outer membrane lipid asymmetry maintenance protein MlaD [Myxococcota bacterium]
MQTTYGRDLAVGLFVLVGLLAVAYLSVRVGGLSYKGRGGMHLVAAFDEIGGLSERAPVRVSGVPVGQVASIHLNEELRALVVLDVDPGLELSADTAASIRTNGLLGDQFVALEPGGEEELLQSGDVVAFTENALNLEKLIGAFVHGSEVGGDE